VIVGRLWIVLLLLDFICSALSWIISANVLVCLARNSFRADAMSIAGIADR
jgi:hypothetical protein